MSARTGRWLLLGALLLGASLSAHAHKPSDAYLTLSGAGHGALRWDIALRDLDYALGLDANDDGAIDWGELRARATELRAWAAARLDVFAAGDAVCTLAAPAAGPALAVEQHSDGGYAVLNYALDCPGGGAVQRLSYRLLFELDPTHRGLLRLVGADGAQGSVVLSAGRREYALPAAPPGALAAFAEYWREGVWHIRAGFDHLLFLTALLLPAVLRREHGRWRELGRFRDAFVELAGIVTAFTLAHSLTLALAALGIINPPSRLVESAIAATVVLAALNNLYPLVPTRRWTLAFALGLIHGFGFAGVLGDLGLPPTALLPALAGFNAGVETGQLAIVCAFLPLAWGLRTTALYRRAILAGGSALVVAIGAIWLLQRSLNVDFGLGL